MQSIIRQVGSKMFRLQQEIRDQYQPVADKLTEEDDDHNFSKGKINIYEDEISDDDSSKGESTGHQRGFEKNIDKLLKL